MTDAAALKPWWWLDAEERARLGLGAFVERTGRGVLFGDPEAPLRLEIVARTDDAPVRLGAIALRVWGDSNDRRVRPLLHAVLEVLGPRLSEGFDPDALDPADFRSPPASGPARATGPSLTIIDVPSVCDRACVFCHISLRPHHERTPRGADADVDRAIAVTEGPVLFTGDDALAHPSIVTWVEAAARRGAQVSLIGPPRRERTAALAPDLARAGLCKYTTALLGTSPATHDPVAGREGAFEAVVEATFAMRRAGVVVELVTPLVRPVLRGLRGIAELARELTGAKLTLLAYAPDTMVGDAFDAVVPPFDELRVALAEVAALDLAADAIPLCVLPPPMRASGGKRLERTDARLGVVYPEAICAVCDLRPRCPGVPTTVHRVVGSHGLMALRVPGGRHG